MRYHDSNLLRLEIRRYNLRRLVSGSKGELEEARLADQQLVLLQDELDQTLLMEKLEEGIV